MKIFKDLSGSRGPKERRRDHKSKRIGILTAKEKGEAMAVITISRQLGSLGTEIAREVANRLNYTFVEKEQIGKMLAGYGFPEPEVERFDEKRTPIWDYLSIKRTKFLRHIRALIYGLASRDNAVIVGRGGQALLQDLPGTLHVRIIAPFEVRVKRLMESERVDEKRAAGILRRSDSDSFRYIQSFFYVDWNDPNLYDLVINSAKFPMEAAVQMIMDSAHAKEERGRKQKASEKLSDLALQQRVEARLINILGVEFRQLEIGVDKGIVFLKGGVRSQIKKEDCERMISDLEGVKGAENLLSVIRSPWRKAKCGKSLN
jgi:cytidylate kinase